MSNKARGKLLKNMGNIEYIKTMGGTVDNTLDTGTVPANYRVNYYINQLKNYSVNRYKWISPNMRQIDLNLIEENLFYNGTTVLVKPTLTKYVNNYKCKFYYDTVKTYRYNVVRYNIRTNEPYSINLYKYNELIDIQYNSNDFVIINDTLINDRYYNTQYQLAYEYANKLYELDLAFNNNSHKMRFPLIFSNTAISDKDTLGVGGLVTTTNARIVKDAYNRNEVFVQLSDDTVSKKGLLYEQEHADNYLIDFLNTQEKLYEEYFNLIGLYTNKEKNGVYENKELQNEDERGNYITKINYANRAQKIQEIKDKFKIEISLEVR